MKYLGAFLLFMAFNNLNAMPSCTFFGDDKSTLVCLPGNEDTDYVLTKGVISDNVNAKSVYMKSCKVADVDCQAFQGLVDLQLLDLSENRIETIKPGVLNDLNQLRHLNLSHNKITDISNGFLNATNNIEVLDLKGNKIHKIQSGAFDRLTKLTDLDLSNNAIDSQELHQSVFNNNRQLKSVDFSRNDMSGAKEDLLIEVPALETLILDRSFLSEVPSFATRANMKTLKVLILSTNQISRLDDPTIFVNLDDLEILNLGGNAIESISENVFTPLRKVKTIVLKQNRLKQVPEKLFQNMPKLVSVDLSFNELEEIQVSPFRNTPMKNLNLSGNKLTFLPENFSQQLRDAGGKLKKFLFTPNPWQCSCLRDIMEEVKSLGLEYNSGRYNGKEVVCNNDEKSFSCIRH